MINCKICNKEYKNCHSLHTHVGLNHPTMEDYLLKFPEHFENILNEFTHKEGECLIWDNYIDHDRYARYPFGKKLVGVHRWCYEYFNNCCILPEFCVCHSCDNPSCVNPEHLWLGTNLDNIEIEITNLKKFCNENDLPYVSITNYVYGIRKKPYNGFIVKRLEI